MCVVAGPPPTSGQLQHSQMALGIGGDAGTASPRPRNAADEMSRVRWRRAPLLHSLGHCSCCSTANTSLSSQCNKSQQYRLVIGLVLKFSSSCKAGAISY